MQTAFSARRRRHASEADRLREVEAALLGVKA
jgi:hypothetical protein